jgi:hypothetical protein
MLMILKLTTASQECKECITGVIWLNDRLMSLPAVVAIVGSIFVKGFENHIADNLMTACE